MSQPDLPDPQQLRQSARALRNVLESEGIRDSRVLDAIENTPRHRFLPEGQEAAAWDNEAHAIGCGQTISQPYIVAVMTSALQLTPESHVLEIGTGSGYQAAVLSRLCRSVVSVECLPELHRRAQQVLADLGIRNVRCVQGDGWQGWPEEALYDAIIVTAAAPEIPPALPAQLKPGGRLVLPVGPTGGEAVQELLACTRRDEELITRILCQCRFVPLTGGDQSDR